MKDSLPPVTKREETIALMARAAYPGAFDREAGGVVESARMDSALTALESSGYIVEENFELPCSVDLPPATRVRSGCKLSTLITGLKSRMTAPVAAMTAAWDKEQNDD